MLSSMVSQTTPRGHKRPRAAPSRLRASPSPRVHTTSSNLTCANLGFGGTTDSDDDSDDDDDDDVGNSAQLGADPIPRIPCYKTRTTVVKRPWTVVKYDCTREDVADYLAQNNLRKATGGGASFKKYYECRSKSEFVSCTGAARITFDPIDGTSIIEEVDHDHSVQLVLQPGLRHGLPAEAKRWLDVKLTHKRATKPQVLFASMVKDLGPEGTCDLPALDPEKRKLLLVGLCKI